MDPVFSTSILQLHEFGPDKTLFHVDDEGFVPVFIHGICRKFLVDKCSIGVWFGPNHPKYLKISTYLTLILFVTVEFNFVSIRNISERVHSGRKSAEAARFRAVIEAIRAAGNAGVKKLQINTNYINM